MLHLLLLEVLLLHYFAHARLGRLLLGKIRIDMPHVLVLWVHQKNPSVVVHIVFVFVLLKLALDLFPVDSKFLEALG